jgi:hypothetical protein
LGWQRPYRFHDTPNVPDLIAEMDPRCISKTKAPPFRLWKTQEGRIHLHLYPGVLFNEDGLDLVIGEAWREVLPAHPILGSPDRPINE